MRANGRGQAVWLRIYLGYAPGVGKTYAMLHEGRRRKSRGTDVVVGWVQAYDRPRTLDAIGGLEIVTLNGIAQESAKRAGAIGVDGTINAGARTAQDGSNLRRCIASRAQQDEVKS